MRGAARIGAGLALGWSLGLVASCQPPSFTCESDLACEGLADAWCEPTGYCSVPDSACGEAGRRYAPHSGALSGRCVGAGETETGSTGATSSIMGTSGEPGVSTGIDTDGGTTSPLDDGSTSLPTDASTSGADPTEADPPRTVCRGPAVIDEPFTLRLDPRVWGSYEGPGMSAHVQDEELRLVATDVVNGYMGFYTFVPLPTAGWMGAELTAVPSSTAPAEAYVVLTQSNAGYGFSVYEGTLNTYYYDHETGTYLNRTSVPYDPVAHRWLRLVFDTQQRVIEWETSADAIDWALVDDEYELEPDFALESAGLEVGAGAWAGPTNADPLGAFGHAFICEG